MLLAKKDMDALNLSSLDQEQVQKINGIKEGLDLDPSSIYDYGVDISKKLGDFSSELLSKVKVKDAPEVEELLAELTKNIRSIDANSLTVKKPTFLQRIFKTDEIQQFIQKHDNIMPVVEMVKTKLEQCQYQLKKDIETCQVYYEQNASNIEELDCHIIAGRLRAKEAKDDLAKRQAELDESDILAVEELATYQRQIDLLENKLYNLELLRNLAIQNIPKLMILSDGDNVMINKIDTSINMTIPAWESQMVLAVLIARTRTAALLDKSFTDMTNKLIEGNASYLRMTAAEIAAQIERGVIDVESLKKSAQDIEATYKEVRQIREQGKLNRENAIRDLRIIQENVNSAVLMLEDQAGTSRKRLAKA